MIDNHIDPGANPLVRVAAGFSADMSTSKSCGATGDAAG